MLFNIKTSEANKAVVKELTRKLILNSENHVSRIAFAYSISRGNQLSLETDLKDSKGKEYKDEVLFGKYRNYYISLVCQHYGLHKSDPNIGKYIKMHIDHGLELMHKLFENNANFSGLDFLLETIERGIEELEGQEMGAGHVENVFQKLDKEWFAEPLRIRVGNDIITNEAIFFNMNDTSIHNNSMVAVAGNPGTGKTFFSNRFIEQVVFQSGGQVNFLFIDFKGLKSEDEHAMKPFFDKTKAELIDAPHKAFPVNPLSFIDVVNEKNKIMGINKFVDIISHYSNLGKVQQQTLRDATRQVFNSKTGGQYPSFREIYEAVLEIEGSKASTLKEIVQSLGELDLFQTEVEPQKTFLNNNYYLSLSANLPPEVRFTATFLIINYVYNTFMNMPNAPIQGNLQCMRYVLVIDEAHVIFKQKKSQDLLEKVLREVRSKGVSVMLLSQGIEEFNQPSFDFSSMCETVFLFDIKDKTNVKAMEKFLGIGDKLTNKLKNSMENIQKYQLISNLKEFKVAELFKA